MIKLPDLQFIEVKTNPGQDQVVPDTAPFIFWNGKRIEINEFLQETIRFVHPEWSLVEEMAFKTRCNSLIVALKASFPILFQKAEEGNSPIKQETPKTCQRLQIKA